MRQQEEGLTAAGVKVVVVTFDSVDYAKRYVRQTKMPWPVLRDPSKTMYAAYSMRKASWWALANPYALLKYTLLLLLGTRLGPPGSDVTQLGGDVLIGPDGMIRMHFVSRGPHDRPSVAKISRLAQPNSM